MYVRLLEESRSMQEYNTLDDFTWAKKTVLIRVDFNLPLDKKTLEILDTTRIKHALPTLQELLEKQAKIVILAHQGRPDSWDFISLDKHAKALSNLLHTPVEFVPDLYGKQAQKKIQDLQPGEILMLDNMRKYPDETEKKTAEEHAKTPLIQNLYPLADIFVNDAFAAAHRAQCSLIGFTPVLPSCAGRLMEKELTTLNKILQHPDKPAIFLFGGAKFSDVIITIQHLLDNNIADKILLTGLPANAFLHATGTNLGDTNTKTLEEEGSNEQFTKINKLYTTHSDKIILPKDVAIDKDGTRHELRLDDLPTSASLYDIGEHTITLFKELLQPAKTIFISGPCGVFENTLFIKGTKEIFTYIAHHNAFSIAGGGHTVAAIDKLRLTKNISHISTGGGSLERFLMGKPLPVIEALKHSKKQTSMV